MPSLMRLQKQAISSSTTICSNVIMLLVSRAPGPWTRSTPLHDKRKRCGHLFHDGLGPVFLGIRQAPGLFVGQDRKSEPFHPWRRFAEPFQGSLQETHRRQNLCCRLHRHISTGIPVWPSETIPVMKAPPRYPGRYLKTGWPARWNPQQGMGNIQMGCSYSIRSR